jgi:hypothetical protein
MTSIAHATGGPRKPCHPLLLVVPRRGSQQARSVQRHRCAVRAFSVSRPRRTVATRVEKKSVADLYLPLDKAAPQRTPERERTRELPGIGCTSSCSCLRRPHATNLANDGLSPALLA